MHCIYVLVNPKIKLVRSGEKCAVCLTLYVSLHALTFLLLWGFCSGVAEDLFFLGYDTVSHFEAT
jgi:hypothetical protein